MSLLIAADDELELDGEHDVVLVADVCAEDATRSRRSFRHPDGKLCELNRPLGDGTWLQLRCRRYATCPVCRTQRNRAKQPTIVHNLSREHRRESLCRVSFTIANGERLAPLIAQLYGDFAKLRDADRKTTTTIIGGLVKLDVKRTKADQWHPHFDAILEVREGVTERQLHRELSARWTGIIAKCERVGAQDIDRERLAGYDGKLSFNGIADHSKLMAEYREAVGRKPTHFKIGKWRNTKAEPTRWEQLPKVDHAAEPSCLVSPSTRNLTDDLPPVEADDAWSLIDRPATKGTTITATGKGTMKAPKLTACDRLDEDDDHDVTTIFTTTTTITRAICAPKTTWHDCFDVADEGYSSRASGP